jgi:hypothetical protein
MVPCGEDKGGGWLVDASSSSSGGNGSISAKFPGAVCFIWYWVDVCVSTR